MVAKTYLIKYNKKFLGYVVYMYTGDVDEWSPWNKDCHLLDCNNGYFYRLNTTQKFIFQTYDDAKNVLDRHIKRFRLMYYKIIEDLDGVEFFIDEDEFTI